MNKKYRIRPSKANGVLSIIMGVVFFIIGVTFAIPSSGAFGIFWTLMSVVITVVNVRAAFSENGGSYEIIEEATSGKSGEKSADDRLRELESLRSAGLISEDEYTEKRREIIDSI